MRAAGGRPRRATPRLRKALIKMVIFANAYTEAFQPSSCYAFMHTFILSYYIFCAREATSCRSRLSKIRQEKNNKRVVVIKLIVRIRINNRRARRFPPRDGPGTGAKKGAAVNRHRNK
jgi:hypothetical protein